MAECKLRKWAVLGLALALLAAFAAADDPSQLVTGLPGQPAVGFKQYAGFIDALPGSHLFYWFVTAQNGDPTTLPVTFWFNGGPGCSSLGNGGLSELGPFYVNSTGDGLFLNEFAWNQDANIVFVESPVGVGYSYSDNTSVYQFSNDNQTAEDAHAFLVGWFKKFPEYAQNEVYLAGESYAGHYVPQLALKVVQYNDDGSGFYINLKGFLVGNAWTDPYSDNKGAAQFYYTHALISESTYLTLLQNCDFAHDLPVDQSEVNQTCTDAAIQAINVEMGEIDIYNIYGPYCTSSTGGARRAPTAQQSSFLRRNLFLQDPYPDPCADPITPYLNRDDVVSAFHASNYTNGYWTGCSTVVHGQYSRNDITTSVLPVYRTLLTRGLKIWVFSGDVDAIVPVLSTRFWLRTLHLPIQTPWYAWNHSTQVGGWTEQYQGLTFATVRQAGHMVPLTQPERALDLFQHFLKGEPLPPFSNTNH